MLWLHHYREVAHLRSHNWPSNSPHRLVFSRISDPRHRHQSEDWITPPPRRPRRSAACQHSKILPDICFVGRFHGLCIAACMLLSIFGRHGTGGRETVQPPTLFLDPFGAEREHFADSSLSKSEAHGSEESRRFRAWRFGTTCCVHQCFVPPSTQFRPNSDPHDQQGKPLSTATLSYHKPFHRPVHKTPAAPARGATKPSPQRSYPRLTYASNKPYRSSSFITAPTGKARTVRASLANATSNRMAQQARKLRYAAGPREASHCLGMSWKDSVWMKE
jgi:hypothetical protein